MPTKYAVHTWADGFGLWHCRVTGPFPKSAGFRRAAGRAIRSELSERGAIGAGYRIRLSEVYVSLSADSRVITAEFKEGS